MEVLWFCLIAILVVLFALRDGFDLGSGLIYLFLTRTEPDRRAVLAAGGRSWDGNEVWLLFAGAALYCAFPVAYSSAAFRISAATLLGLLILRGVDLQLRNRVVSPTPRRAFDTAYGVATVFVAFTLGAAAALMIPGLPRWFAWLSGLGGLAILTLHSASWIALHSTGELQIRCRQFASGVWWAVLATYAAIAIAALSAQPHVLDDSTALIAAGPISIFAVIALAGLIGTRLCLSVGFDLGTFTGASCLIAGVLTSVAAGLYPNLLSHNPAGTGASLNPAWWLLAFVPAAGYNLSIRRFDRHKATLPLMAAGD